MATRQNPRRLNALQLRTLTILQALARLPDAARDEETRKGREIACVRVDRVAGESALGRELVEIGVDRLVEPHPTPPRRWLR